MFTNFLEEHILNKEDNILDVSLEKNIYDIYSTEDEIVETIEENVFYDMEYLYNILENKKEIDPGLKYFLSEEYFFLNNIDSDEEFKESIESYMRYKGLNDINRLEGSFEILGFVGRSAKGISGNVKGAIKNFKDKRAAAKREKLPINKKIIGGLSRVYNFLLDMLLGIQRGDGGYGIFNLLGLVSFVFMSITIIKFTRSYVRSKKNVEKLDRIFKVYAQDINHRKYDPDKANRLTMTSLRENVLLKQINTCLNVQNLKQTLVPDNIKPIQSEAEYNKKLMEMKTAVKPYTDIYGITIENNKVIMNKKLIKDIPETNRITSLGYGPNSITNLSNNGRKLLLKLNREVGGDMNTFLKKHENSVQEVEKIANDPKVSESKKGPEQNTKMSKKDAKKIIDYNQKATKLGMFLYCKISQQIMRQTLNMTGNTIKSIFRVYS